jgi:hypothetical protein
MALKPERRAELLSATHEAAGAFAEDMAHVRETVNKQSQDRGELRRLSNVLRRFLIDNGGDLKDIAAPRVGRIAILTPDNKPVYQTDGKRPHAFFASGGVMIFGVLGRAAAAIEGSTPHLYENFDPAAVIESSPDNFLAQKVLCLAGKWVRRRDALKYIANIASGVHSGAPKSDTEKLIARIRQSASFTAMPNGLVLKFKIDGLFSSEPAFKYERDAIDPVLVEVLAAGHFLEMSPDIRRLEEAIRKELS